jgi:hypothetical protein
VTESARSSRSDVIGRVTLWRRRLFLAMVAVLPLHTVFLSAWISWKPFLAVLIVLAGMDLFEGIQTRTWPWARAVPLAIAVFLLIVLTGWPEAPYLDRFLRLTLALVVGALVLLVTERSLRTQGMIEQTLRVVFWSGAAMALSGYLFSLVLVGAFGARTLNTINELPGLFRVAKPAYLKTGFLALTNWHQDPGYGAAWANLWAVLALVAGARKPVSGRRWLDAAVVGGLAFTVVMAFSRTGWLALFLGLAFTSWLLVRRGWCTRGEIAKRLGAAALTAVVLLASVGAADVSDRGGDLDLQFAFRFSQGWDLLASITGLFATSDSFADVFDESEERADVWPEYVQMFRDHPWTGVGLSVGWQTNSVGQEPHNLALELLAETGLVGLAAFAALLALIFTRGGGVPGTVALVAAFLPAMSQTVLFEPAWWFAGGLFLAGRTARPSLLRAQEATEEMPGCP